MSSEGNIDLNLNEGKQLDISVQNRNFEIDLFWKRSFFFWGFIASAFIGYATLRANSPSLALVVACFGMVCAFAWTLLNRGSKYWQESWEQKVERHEIPIIGKIFAKEEPVQDYKFFWLRARRYSVSKLVIGMSDYVFILWVCVVVGEFLQIYYPSTAQIWIKEYGVKGFVMFSIIFLFFLGICGKSTPRTSS